MHQIDEMIVDIFTQFIAFLADFQLCVDFVQSGCAFGHQIFEMLTIIVEFFFSTHLFGNVPGDTQHTDQPAIRIPHRCFDGLIQTGVAAVLIRHPFLVGGRFACLYGNPIFFTKEISNFLIKEIVVGPSDDVFLGSAAQGFETGVAEQVNSLGIFQPHDIGHSFQQRAQLSFFLLEPFSSTANLLPGLSQVRCID